MADSLPQGAVVPAVLHELRTWTNAISGWTRILRVRRAPADIDRAVGAIERSSLAMERFIADLGVVSRDAGAAFGLYLEDVSLRTVVDAAIDVVRPKAELKEVSLVWTPAERPPVVCGDELRLQQIVCNLLLNALQFSPRGGRVTITLTSTADYARLAIEDSGPGISRTFLPSLFEPFAQDPAVPHAEGSGLGLAIAKALAESQQGHLEVEPGGGGRGAVFHLHLPLIRHQRAAGYG